MEDTKATSRREALGLASIAVAAISFGATSVGTASAAQPRSARPTADEMARAKRLYGGEFGGGMR